MDNVPLLVRICTSIVEQKGLEIVGIYRIPGNNAAVTNLTEMVNKGADNVEVYKYFLKLNMTSNITLKSINETTYTI